MGDSHALPGFGQVDLDLDLEDEGGQTPARGIPAATPPAFGQIDFDVAPGEEPVPPSTSRVFAPKDASTHATRRKIAAIHDESTRVVHGDVLSNITRPPPALTVPAPSPHEGHTRAWSEIEDQILASHAASDVPSGSGVAARDGRVAAMRELYAQGDAAGALALASDIGDSLRPAPVADHPDASIVVEVGGEESLDLSDPFGGLIPLDAELASNRTVVPPPARVPTLAPSPPVAAPQLTLTERHSIPRVLSSAGEISKLPIDHRAGFLLAHVDGMQTLEEILDVCAMPATEALQVIAKLKEMGVIEFD